MPDLGLRALVQSMLSSTASEDGLMINELARRFVLSGITVSAAGVFSFSIPVFNISILTGTASRLAAFDGSGNGTSILLTNAYVDPAAAIAYSKLNLTGLVVDADIAAAAAIAWTKLSKTGSSLADLTTRSATDLTSGTLPDARFPATLPAASGVNLTALNATQLTSGTVPQARLGNGVNTRLLDTTATNQNNWAPGLVGDTVIFWSGASDITVTGFAGGISGQRITFKNTGTNIATFSHNSGSSSAGNKLFNIATSGGTPVAGGGYLVYQYDGTQWQLVEHEQGAYISRAFTAGDFTASAGNWTLAAGDQTTFKYKLQGKRLQIIFKFVTTTVSSTPSSLRALIPGSFTVASDFNKVSYGINNGTENIVLIEALTSHNTQLYFYNLPFAASANWAIATDTTQVTGEVDLEIT